MPKTIAFTKLIVVLGLCAAAGVATAGAQTASNSILINDIKPPQVVPGEGGVEALSLEVVYTLLDPSRQAVPGGEIDSAVLDISTGSYPAIPQQVATPWSVVILMDGSATMANFKATSDFKKARDAAAALVGGQGQKAITFAVLKFDNLAPTIMDFSTDGEKLANAIKKLPATQSGNSCLNNGAFEAINKLAAAPGRRAVIIFTASADNCFQRSAKEVAEQANRNDTQLYAVGLKGYSIAQEELDALVGPTGGLAQMVEVDKLGFGFTNVLNVLNNQWSAIATMYPEAGQQDATLTIKFKNGTQFVSGPIPFNSPKDFPLPPSIEIIGTVQSASDGVTFNLKIVTPEMIDHVIAQIESKETGLEEVRLTLDEIQEQGNKAPTLALKEGQEYRLILTPENAAGQPLHSPRVAEFKYARPQLQVEIANFEVATLEKPEFVVTVDPPKPEGVVKFQIFLIKDGADNTPIEGTMQTVAVGEALVIPASDTLPEGDYLIVVQALDGSVPPTALAEDKSEKFHYTPPSSLDNLIYTLQTSQWAIVGITAVICVAFLVLLGIVAAVGVAGRRGKVKSVEMEVREKKIQYAKPVIDSGVDFSAPSQPLRSPEPISRPRASEIRAPSPVVPVDNLPKARLVAQFPATALLQTEIGKTPLTIGRRSGNDVALNVDNALGVSGQHCQITFANGQYYLEDVGSTYGTTLNGATIAKNQPVPLPDGALIGLGPKVIIQFRLG